MQKREKSCSVPDQSCFLSLSTTVSDKTRRTKPPVPMVQMMDDLRTASGSASIERLETHSRLFLTASLLRVGIFFLGIELN